MREGRVGCTFSRARVFRGLGREIGVWFPQMGGDIHEVFEEALFFCSPGMLKAHALVQMGVAFRLLLCNKAINIITWDVRAKTNEDFEFTFEVKHCRCVPHAVDCEREKLLCLCKGPELGVA